MVNLPSCWDIISKHMYPLVWLKLHHFVRILLIFFWGRTPRPLGLQAQLFQILLLINKNKFQFAYEPLHIITYIISCTIYLQKQYKTLKILSSPLLNQHLGGKTYWFCAYLVRENFFQSGKNQGSLREFFSSKSVATLTYTCGYSR